MRLLLVALVVPVICLAGEFTIISSDSFGRLSAVTNTFRTVNAVDSTNRLFRSVEYVPPAAYDDLKIVETNGVYDLQIMTAQEKADQAAAVQAASDQDIEFRINSDLSDGERVQIVVTLQYLNEIIAGRTNFINEAEAQAALIQAAKDLRAQQP